MSTLLKPLQARTKLLEKKLRIFTPNEFSILFNFPSSKTKYFLEKQTSDGLFLRLKKGLYTLATDMPSEGEIANVIYRPSYLSFEYALAFWNLIPEMPYQITSATTKPTRIFSLPNSIFIYYTIKKQAYTGYSLFSETGTPFLIAEKEKAFVDYLYFESLGKKTHNDRLNIKDLDIKKIISYAKLYQRKGIVKLIKKYANPR